jgi:pimeloyl-ACP methyl ester carboxylesterase
VVATDYQGLGTLGPHPYMAVRPGAYGMLDSVRAVQKSFPAIGKKTLLAGYSQGAGAAFGAAALQPSYAADLDIRGIITTGISYTTPETVATMRDATANQASYTLIYPLYIALVAQQSDPALKEADTFSDKALPLFEATRHACIGQLVIDALRLDAQRKPQAGLRGGIGQDPALAGIPVRKTGKTGLYGDR